MSFSILNVYVWIIAHYHVNEVNVFWVQWGLKLTKFDLCFKAVHELTIAKWPWFETTAATHILISVNNFLKSFCSWQWSLSKWCQLTKVKVFSKNICFLVEIPCCFLLTAALKGHFRRWCGSDPWMCWNCWIQAFGNLIIYFATYN
jgi:hypothetical protein